MRQPEAKKPQLREIYFCCYYTIVFAHGVLSGNKLMSGSTGGARYYVRPLI